MLGNWRLGFEHVKFERPIGCPHGDTGTYSSVQVWSSGKKFDLGINIVNCCRTAGIYLLIYLFIYF